MAKKISIKYKLMVIFSLIWGLSFAVLIVREITTEEKDVFLPTITSNFKDLEKQFYQKLNEDTQLLSATREIFANDDKIMGLFIEKDRNSLYQYVYPLSQKLHNQYGITGINFILPNYHVFLRVHNPNIYDDLVTRRSLAASQKTRQPAVGMELGLTAFALRVVSPLLNNRNVVGFIEFSKDIDSIITELKENIPELQDVTLFARKQEFDPKLIKDEYLNKKLSAHWNDYPDYVAVNSVYYDPAKPFFTNEKSSIKNEQLDDLNQGKTVLGIYKNEAKSLTIGGFPFYDSAGTNIGLVVASIDISDFEMGSKKGLFLDLLLFSVIFTLMLCSVYFFTNKTIIKPVKLLSATANEIARKGNLSLRTGIKKRDELGELSDYFDKMTDDLLKTTVSRDYVDNIINNMTDTLIVLDKNRKITTINHAALDLLGYSENELIGKNINTIVEEELSLDKINECVRKDFETAYKSKKNEYIPVLASSSQLIGRDGEKEGIILIAKDITEQKKALVEKEKLMNTLSQKNKELEDANKELDHFVHLASHDLRSPVIGISNFVSLLEKACKDKLDEKEYELLLKIKNATARMSDLIDKIITLTKISTIKNTFEFVDMNEVINTVKDVYEFELKKYNGELIIAQNLPCIECDKTKIGEVFFNLVGNAIKYSSKKENPKIEIGYSSDDEFHQFYVRDNGIGIDHKKIFDLFSLLHTSSEYTGSGIGLSIVKKVIEDHGGTIWLESEEGKGTTFYFSLLKNMPAPVAV